MDEAAVMVKGFMAWVWVAYEPFSKRTLWFWLSWNRNGIQMLKDRTESFDDHLPCRRKACILEHVWRLLNLIHIPTQPETPHPTNNIKEVMKMLS
ncbi:MAG: hypothetical protein QXR32_07345 [Candidatus Caldarchaeum sp.]